MLNNEFTDTELELELLQLESAILLEDTDTAKGKEGAVAKLKAFFTKIFKWIGEAISTLKNKTMARVMDVQKAFNKHKVQGNPTLEFKGAEALPIFGKTLDSLEKASNAIDQQNTEEGLDRVGQVILQNSKIQSNEVFNKVGKATVGDLGNAINDLNQLNAGIQSATKVYKSNIKDAKKALDVLGRGTEEAKKKVNLEKKKANYIKKIVSLFQSIANKGATVLVAGIVAMKKAGKSDEKAKPDTSNQKQLSMQEESFFEDDLFNFDESFFLGEEKEEESRSTTLQEEIDAFLNESEMFESELDLEDEFDFNFEDLELEDEEDFNFNFEEDSVEEDIDSLLESLAKF